MVGGKSRPDGRVGCASCAWWLFVVRVWAVASGSRERVVTFGQDEMGNGSVAWKLGDIHTNIRSVHYVVSL